MLSPEEVESLDKEQLQWEAAHPPDSPAASSSGRSRAKDRVKSGAGSAYNTARPSWWNDAMGETADEQDPEELAARDTQDWFEDDDTLLRQMEDAR